MACVAARAVVVEIFRKIRTILDRYLVIRMEMTLPARIREAKLLEDSLRWRHAHCRFTKHPHKLRLPVAVNAPPTITNKTEHAQLAMPGAVTAVDRASLDARSARMFCTSPIRDGQVTATARV